jgi:hypothetical protein
MLQLLPRALSAKLIARQLDREQSKIDTRVI